MAKKNSVSKSKKETTVENIVEDVATPVTETVEEVAETVEEAAPVIRPKSNPVIAAQATDAVLVRGVKDHQCTIMKQPVTIKKGQDIKLTRSVATILAQAGVVIFR